MNRITYDEFREEVEKLGYKARKDSTGMIWVETIDGLTVSRIGNERYSIIVYKADVQEVAELSVRLAITPLDERESQYYLRLKSHIMPEAHSYLNYKTGEECPVLDTKWNGYGYRAIFTKEEIDELNEKYNVLDSFRMEEVK